MAWKIRRKYKRDGIRILSGVENQPSIDELAAFMAERSEPNCPTCGEENHLYDDGPSSVWGCWKCDHSGGVYYDEQGNAQPLERIKQDSPN